MKKHLAALAAVPMLALAALPASAAGTLPSTVKIPDGVQDTVITFMADGTKMSGFPHKADIFKATAVNRADDVQFTMVIDDLTKGGVSGTFTDNDGLVKPKGFFSFRVRIDGEKQASLFVARGYPDGVPGVFEYASDSVGDRIECGEVTIRFSLTKDRIRYTIPTDCFSGANKARVSARSALADASVHAIDETRYTKAFKVG